MVYASTVPTLARCKYAMPCCHWSPLPKDTTTAVETMGSFYVGEKAWIWLPVFICQTLLTWSCSEQYPSMHSRSAFFKHLQGVLQNNTHGAHGNFQLCPLPIANINFDISSFHIHSILCLSTSLISLRTMSRKELNDCRHSCDWAKVEEMELMDTWAREGWRNLKTMWDNLNHSWDSRVILETGVNFLCLHWKFETFRTVIPSYHPNPSIYCTSLSLVSLSTVKTGRSHGTASTFTACCSRRSISGHCAVAAMLKGGSQEWEENIPGTSKHTNKTGRFDSPNSIFIQMAR